MHLIFLWFGLWKNSESMYVPAWMKVDTKTYYHVKKVNGESINTISPLCQAAIDKDRQAFVKIMERIKYLDEEESTVIMMQIENEIGLLGTGCDYSDSVRAAFAEQIPQGLADIYGVNGTWKEAFGEDAEENFMAYYFIYILEAPMLTGTVSTLTAFFILGAIFHACVGMTNVKANEDTIVKAKKDGTKCN